MFALIHDLVPEALAGERIDRAVAVIAGVTRAEAASLVDDGRVTVNGVIGRHRSRRVALGDHVEVDVRIVDSAALLEADPTVAFTVVHEDDDVIVVDKPAGLVVYPGAGNQHGTLVHGLLARYPDMRALAVGENAIRPGIVHRLDKGTSGLLMVGRNASSVEALIAQLAGRAVTRQYRALAWGRFEARTRYTVLAAYSQPDPTTLVECRLETGRTHQIRVHLSAIGHPVVGDGRYGGARNAVHSPRPWLHAQSLAFVHPATGEAMSFESDVPSDLLAVLATLS